MSASQSSDAIAGEGSTGRAGDDTRENFLTSFEQIWRAVLPIPPAGSVQDVRLEQGDEDAQRCAGHSAPDARGHLQSAAPPSVEPVDG